MAHDFRSARVIVTGGSKGIGRAIALGFARAGASVSICARGAPALEQTRREIVAAGASAHAAICDLADGAAVRAYVRSAAAALGGLDILVNNASGFGLGDSEAEWADSLNVDVLAMVRASQEALAHMPASLEAARSAAHPPCILHIASISGLRPSRRTPAYAAVKAAMIQYTGSQALLLASRGIRVNAIAPGSIEFPGGTWEARRLAGDPLYTRIREAIPLGRLGTPEEVADVALFLASPGARWITGQTLVVDGGQILA